jgi:hypothetical protein
MIAPNRSRISAVLGIPVDRDLQKALGGDLEELPVRIVAVGAIDEVVGELVEEDLGRAGAFEILAGPRVGLDLDVAAGHEQGAREPETEPGAGQMHAVASMAGVQRIGRKWTLVRADIRDERPSIGGHGGQPGADRRRPT